jgi:hypothetical protein
LILDPYDLWLPLKSFVNKNGSMIMKKIEKAPLPPDAICFDNDFVTEHIPYLPEMLNCTLQPGIVSLKQEIFPKRRGTR